MNKFYIGESSKGQTPRPLKQSGQAPRLLKQSGQALKWQSQSGQAPRLLKQSGQALRLHSQSGQAPRSNSGQAMMVTTIFFMVISLVIIFGLTEVVTRQLKTARVLTISQSSYLVAEAAAEDVVYRLKTGKNVLTTETLTLNGHTATTTMTDVAEGKQITAEAEVGQAVRLAEIVVTEGSGTSFFYGVQTGNGGFDIQNSASVKGNVYSNGPVSGANNNVIYGDVISAGASGLITGVHATGTAFANTITNSDIDKDAYYQSISETTVDGTLYPGSPDQPLAPLPIDDSLVEEWKTLATDGGTITTPCPYTISTNTTIGPKKIDCDLQISGGTIDITGPIWVNGNIQITNSPIIKVDASIGNKSVPIIADNPTNQTTSSKITIANSASFQGNGNKKSFILLLSQNDDAENSGSNVAINIANSAGGSLLLYAGHGEVVLNNNINLKEVTAYKIKLLNSAQVIYESGLANLLFTSGPGGGYVVQQWKEI